MTSIRRTLSPYQERPYQNGGNQLLDQSPPHKGFSDAKTASSLSSMGLSIWKFLAGIFFLKNSRKGLNLWKRSFYRCLIFFFIGFLLGMAPFGHIDDIEGRDYSFQANLVVGPDENVKEDDSKDQFVDERPEENFAVEKLGLRMGFDVVPRKQLIVVTPTYNRALQAYYLNRLGHVLRLVPPPILWIVVEMNAASTETADTLRKIGVMYRHLVCSKNLTSIKDRGVHQRNTALEHIAHHKLDGIIYFADDDNIYSLELFERMRETSRFGTWPVAMLAQSKNKATLEGPVCNGSQVIGWNTNEKSKRLRRFHVDMSGFAFNSTILWDPKRWHRPTSDLIRQLDTVKEGFQETTFIEQVVEDESQMEGISPGCSRIMNWHLHLEARKLSYPKDWLLQENLDVVIPTH